MQLRLLLPPNIQSRAPLDAIPVKVEIARGDGSVAPPEKVPAEALAELDEANRLAAFAIMQWGGGALGSFLQLSREQLAELVKHLHGKTCFYWAGRSRRPILWAEGRLQGVSPHLGDGAAKLDPAPAAPPDPESRDKPGHGGAKAAPSARSDGEPMRIDGSSHFLAISLPSREHPHYQEIRELLQNSRFKLEPSNRKWWLRDRHQTLEFLGRHWDDLEDRYQAVFTKSFRQRTAKLREAKLRARISEDDDGYTIDVAIRAGKTNEREIRDSLNAGRHYIESGDKVYLLKRNSLTKLEELQKTLAESPDAPLLHRGRYRVSKTRAPQIDEPLQSLDPNFKPPAAWQARSKALKDLSKLPRPDISPELDRILRPYQKLGVAWLRHLFDHELGGILADEMGLGKTLQALALLASLKRSREKGAIEAPSGLSLVVCPASLVENWRREALRFCPELRVFVNHGDNRLVDERDFRSLDLVITSYGTLIRDEALLASRHYLCVVGDEAQHIKNRKTQNAQSIATLSARGRFLLTGTPVENSIQDLMSMLDFIMPGGWKPVPNGARGDERRWHEERVKDQATPYILRRAKEAVAPELPEKLEQVVYVEMSEEQKAAYERVRLSAEREIARLESAGASQGSLRMKALAQLLRMRQACCDPRLVDDSLSADASAKRGSFLELLEESMDGGHRILLFSQFVSILTLLREDLDAAEIPYCYIDGSTRNRMQQVDRFNGDPEIPLFLISLKAGGTGLNLAAADTVVHFDPWWNPAVESQATDRAHRIGQTRVVTSYKLIAADSVEEKVLDLQGRKRRLLESVFEASEAANANIAIKDLKELIANPANPAKPAFGSRP